MPELQNAEFPVLQADALKFAQTFRRQVRSMPLLPCLPYLRDLVSLQSITPLIGEQIPKEMSLPLFPIFTNLLTSESYVVFTYVSYHQSVHCLLLLLLLLLLTHRTDMQPSA